MTTITYKQMWDIVSFSDFFLKSQLAMKYMAFSLKLQSLLKILSEGPINEYNHVRENMMIAVAVTGDKGQVLFANEPHAKYPYAMKPEVMMKLRDDLKKQREEWDIKSINIGIIKKEDMFSEGQENEVPMEIGPKEIAMFKGIIFCNCIIGMDGFIIRPKTPYSQPVK